MAVKKTLKKRKIGSLRDSKTNGEND